MQNLFFYLGKPEVQCPTPDNWQDLQLELSFENNPEPVLNSTKLIWKGQNATYMNNWVLGGLQGKVGIFEGIPLTIRICDTLEVVFDGIIDLTDVDTTFACDIIACKIRDKKLDMISQLFDSVSYAYLATPTSKGGGGAINPAPQVNGGDYVVIPYQRNDIPDYVQLFTLGLSIFIVVDKINDISIKLSGLVSGEGSAVADTSAKAGADADGSILGMLYIIGYIIYLAALLFVLYELMKAAFNYLISPVFTKFGMYAKDLIGKACDYFGIGFESSILKDDPVFNNLVIMPVKTAWSDNRTFTNTLFDQYSLGAGSTINKRMEYDDLFNWQHNGNANNFGAYGYYDGTPGDFVRAMSVMFNAKAKIILDTSGKPVLHFERWDYVYDLSTYKLPNVSDQVPFNSQGLFNTTGQSRSAFRTNASELAANYEVAWQMDTSDENTYNSYEGTRCMCTTRPIVVNEIKNVLLQHLEKKNIPFAHAFRKDVNTAPEIVLAPIYTVFSTIYNLIADVANTIINVYNYVANLISLPTINPIATVTTTMPAMGLGHMLLTAHTTSVPKAFIAGPSQSYGSLPIFSDWNGRSFSGVTVYFNDRGQINMALRNLSAQALMRDFHFSSLPQTVTPGLPSLAKPYPVSTPYFNQYLIYKNISIPLCCKDFDEVHENNVITTFDNEQARVDSLKWNTFKGMALIDYRVQKQYTSNLDTSYVIDGKIVSKSI